MNTLVKSKCFVDDGTSRFLFKCQYYCGGYTIRDSQEVSNMGDEKKTVKLLLNKERPTFEELYLYEVAPDDGDMVLVKTTINGQKINIKGENFFSALLSLRKELEKENIQIVCNGAAKNVYPSPMQMSMGSGRTAYKLSMGQQATNSNMVDIFDCDEELDFVDIVEQSKYYTDWLQSVMG